MAGTLAALAQAPRYYTRGWQTEQQTATPRSTATGRASLIERARNIPGDISRHMLELAATYVRAADSLAPAPAVGEAATVTRREILQR